MSTAPDPELIRLARESDDVAIAELYRRHRPAALRFALGLADPATAEDLVSEAFARILAALQDGGGPTVSFRSYLLTAVRNAYVGHVRRDARLVWTGESDELDGPQPSSPDDPDHRYERRLVAAAYGSLPERWQAVLWHTLVERDDHATVGRLLGIKPNAVSALAYRARDGLRDAYLAAHLAEAEDEECRRAQELLPSYARGRLSRPQARRLEEHVDGCPRCKAALAELDEIRSNLGGILAPAVLGAAASSYVLPGAAATLPLDVVSWARDLLGRRLLVRGVGVQAGAVAAAAVLAVAASAIVAVGHADRSATERPEAGRPPSVATTRTPGTAPPSGAASPSAPEATPTRSARREEPAANPAYMPVAATSPATPSAPAPTPGPTAGPTGGPTGGQPGGQSGGRGGGPTTKPTGKPSPSPSPPVPPRTPPPSGGASPTSTPPPGDDLSLGSGVRLVEYGPRPDGTEWHLEVDVVSTLDRVHLRIDLPGLMSMNYPHAGPGWADATCTPTMGRVDCEVVPGTGPFAVDVVVNTEGISGLMVVSAAGNVDPNPDNNADAFSAGGGPRAASATP